MSIFFLCHIECPMIFNTTQNFLEDVGARLFRRKIEIEENLELLWVIIFYCWFRPHSYRSACWISEIWLGIFCNRRWSAITCNFTEFSLHFRSLVVAPSNQTIKMWRYDREPKTASVYKKNEHCVNRLISQTWIITNTRLKCNKTSYGAEVSEE